LLEELKQFKKAKHHLIKAINAIPSSTYEVDAQAKRAEIEQLIHEIEAITHPSTRIFHRNVGFLVCYFRNTSNWMRISTL